MFTRIHALCVAATLVLASSLAVGISAPAQATVGDVVCTPPSATALNYSPALTSSPQDVTGTGTWALTSCSSVAAPAVTSGTAVTSTSAPNRSCLNLTGSSSSSTTITWNTGQTSTIAVNNLVTVVGGVYAMTRTGSVTSGLFAGDTVVVELVGAATDILLCTAGLGTVSSLSTTTTLVFS